MSGVMGGAVVVVVVVLGFLQGRWPVRTGGQRARASACERAPVCVRERERAGVSVA